MDAKKTPELLLETWFGELTQEGMPTETRRLNRWFNSTTDFDRQLKWLFEKDLLQSGPSMAPHWRDQPKYWLAYILLMDQVPRNIFRGTAQAFAFDKKALWACKAGLKKGIDSQLALCERAFFYMPLQHSESKTHQNLSIEKFASLTALASGDSAQQFAQQALKSAKTHLTIINQFNRFPHRNTVLGRENSPQEAWFLDTTQNNFGQTAKK